MATYDLKNITNLITKKLLELTKEARMLEKDYNKDAKFMKYNSYKSMHSKITENLIYFTGVMADFETQMTTPAMKAKGTRLGSKKYK